jgi:hypothetical protein
MSLRRHSELQTSPRRESAGRSTSFDAKQRLEQTRSPARRAASGFDEAVSGEHESAVLAARGNDLDPMSGRRRRPKGVP